MTKLFGLAGLLTAFGLLLASASADAEPTQAEAQKKSGPQKKFDPQKKIDGKKKFDFKKFDPKKGGKKKFDFKKFDPKNFKKKAKKSDLEETFLTEDAEDLARTPAAVEARVSRETHPGVFPRSRSVD